MIKPIEKALSKIPNRFLLTTVVARRWENIVAGNPELVEKKPDDTTLDIVLREIIDERVEVDTDERQIQLAGQLTAEESAETVFTEGFVPDAAGVKENLPED